MQTPEPRPHFGLCVLISGMSRYAPLVHIAAVTGWSGSGKTTLIEAMIRTLIARGLRVGAVKHTHHPLNHHRRGDTGRFEAAGANPVVLTNGADAVIFTPAGTALRPLDDLSRLLSELDVDVVLIEGFKSLGGWPKVALQAEHRRSAEDVLGELERRWSS